MYFRKEAPCLWSFHSEVIYFIWHCSKTLKHTELNGEISFQTWKTGFPDSNFSWTVLVVRGAISEFQLFPESTFRTFWWGAIRNSLILCFSLLLPNSPLTPVWPHEQMGFFFFFFSRHLKKQLASSPGARFAFAALPFHRPALWVPASGCPDMRGPHLQASVHLLGPGLLPGVCRVLLPGMAASPLCSVCPLLLLLPQASSKDKPQTHSIYGASTHLAIFFFF